MNKEEKIAKQKALLKKYYDSATLSLTKGVRDLKYFMNPEVDALEAKLIKYQEFFTKIPKSGKEFKAATEGLEDLTNYLIHLFNQELLIDQLEVDENYSPEISRADLEYQKKMAKAFEAKQKNAPGFDGQGGGVGRDR